MLKIGESQNSPQYFLTFCLKIRRNRPKESGKVKEIFVPKVEDSGLDLHAKLGSKRFFHPDPISIRPNLIFVGIVSPSRYRAQCWWHSYSIGKKILRVL